MSNQNETLCYRLRRLEPLINEEAALRIEELEDEIDRLISADEARKAETCQWRVPQEDTVEYWAGCCPIRTFPIRGANKFDYCPCCGKKIERT